MTSAAVADELMGITDAKTEFSKRIRRLTAGEVDRVVILKRSNPVAVIVTVDEYERLQEIERMREEIEDVMAVLKARKTDDGARVTLEELEARLTQS
jgi:prevent-host-death family protein